MHFFDLGQEKVFFLQKQENIYCGIFYLSVLFLLVVFKMSAEANNIAAMIAAGR